MKFSWAFKEIRELVNIWNLWTWTNCKLLKQWSQFWWNVSCLWTKSFLTGKTFFFSREESRLRKEETMSLLSEDKVGCHSCAPPQDLAYTRSSNLVGLGWSIYMTQCCSFPVLSWLGPLILFFCWKYFLNILYLK